MHGLSWSSWDRRLDENTQGFFGSWFHCLPPSAHVRDCQCRAAGKHSSLIQVALDRKQKSRRQPQVRLCVDSEAPPLVTSFSQAPPPKRSSVCGGCFRFKLQQFPFFRRSLPKQAIPVLVLLNVSTPSGLRMLPPFYRFLVNCSLQLHTSVRTVQSSPQVNCSVFCKLDKTLRLQFNFLVLQCERLWFFISWSLQLKPSV